MEKPFLSDNQLLTILVKRLVRVIFGNAVEIMLLQCFNQSFPINSDYWASCMIDVRNVFPCLRMTSRTWSRQQGGIGDSDKQDGGNPCNTTQF